MPPPVKAPVKSAPAKTQPTPDSPEQAAMVDDGARPVHVDSDALLAQIQRLQEQVDILNAQRDLPDDPVGRTLMNIAAHVQARCDASADLASRSDEVRQTIVELREKDTLSTDDVELLWEVVGEWVENNPHTDLAYIRQMTRELRKHVLRRDKNN